MIKYYHFSLDINWGVMMIVNRAFIKRNNKFSNCNCLRTDGQPCPPFSTGAVSGVGCRVTMDTAVRRYVNNYF